MSNTKIIQGFISDHLSDEYISNLYEQLRLNEKSLLSPQEVAAKIWDQWKHYRFLARRPDMQQDQLPIEK